MRETAAPLSETMRGGFSIDPEQTTAYFRVTDDAGLTDDNREFIFALSYDDAYTVNGIEETDLFDGIQYAG